MTLLDRKRKMWQRQNWKLRDVDIARSMGIDASMVNQWRARLTTTPRNVVFVRELKAKGRTYSEISNILGLSRQRNTLSRFLPAMRKIRAASQASSEL